MCLKCESSSSLVGAFSVIVQLCRLIVYSTNLQPHEPGVTNHHQPATTNNISDHAKYPDSRRNLLTSQIIWIFGYCSTPAWCGAETKKPTPRCWAHSSCPAKQCLGRRACASRLPNIGRQKLAENARLIETPFVDKRAARMLQGGPLVHVLQGSYFCWRIMDVEGATISDCHVMQIYWYFNYVSTINWSESIPAWWFPQIYLRCKILQFSADHNLSRQNYGVPPSPGPAQPSPAQVHILQNSIIADLIIRI